MTKEPRRLLSKEDSWIRPYLTKYKGLLFLVLGLGLLTFFAGSALMFTSGYLISRSAARPENILVVYVPIVLTRAFGIGRPAFRYVERLASHNWVLKMTSDIRLKLYRSLESRAVSAKAEFQTGNILGILAEDIEHIQNLYLTTIFPTLISWLLSVIIVVALGFFSVPFALLMLLLIGVVVILLPLVSVLVNNSRIYRRKEKRHELYNSLTDSVLGVGDWQYSGRYQEFLTHYNQAEAAVRKEDAALKSGKRQRDLLIQVIFGSIVVALFFWAGTYFSEPAQLNWIAAFVLAFFPLMDAFAPITQGITEIPVYEDSAQRFHQLPTVTETALHQPVDKPLIEDAKIVFEKVSFRYQAESKTILSDFSLTIGVGETIALLGKSGTGKTTLTKILRGDLIPTSGQVRIGGVSSTDLNLEELNVIGVLNQAPHLFNTSILNNVRLGNLKASDEEVMAAIHQAGLTEVLTHLPEGADTLVEEGGKRFSGGEQQRIALARILLQDAPIIIIDEPTIGLDPATERALLETVFAVLKNKTVLWITHHLVGIEHAQRVVFLETGTIKMLGTPSELRQNNPDFQRLDHLDAAE